MSLLLKGLTLGVALLVGNIEDSVANEKGWV